MDKYEKAALGFANKIRKASGRKPLTKLPKGFQARENSCPIANALNNGIEFSVDSWKANFELQPECAFPKKFKKLADLARESVEELDPIEMSIPVPELVRQFVCRFDAGEYPALIKK